MPAGCGGDDRRRARRRRRRRDSAAPAVATTEVEISDFKFAPEAITVEAGDTVTWTSSDDAPHTATADDGSFDTGDLDKGDAAR